MAKSATKTIAGALAPRRSLEDLVLNALPEPPPLRRWTTRIPENVAREIENIAKMRRISVNALISFALDKTLADNGRPSIAEMAPWFESYLLRGVGGGKDVEAPPRGEPDEFA